MERISWLDWLDLNIINNNNKNKRNRDNNRFLISNFKIWITWTIILHSRKKKNANATFNIQVIERERRRLELLDILGLIDDDVDHSGDSIIIIIITRFFWYNKLGEEVRKEESDNNNMTNLPLFFLSTFVSKKNILLCYHFCTCFSCFKLLFLNNNNNNIIIIFYFYFCFTCISRFGSSNESGGGLRWWWWRASEIL